MVSVILVLLCPLFFFCVSAVYAWYTAVQEVPQKSSDKNKSTPAVKVRDNNKLYKQLAVAAAVEELILISLVLIIKAFMFGGGTLSVPALLIASALPFADIAVKAFCKNERIYKLLKKMSVIAIALLVLEVVLFNGKSMTRGTVDKTYTKESFRTEGVLDENTPDVVFKGAGNIYIDDLPEGTKAVIVKLSQEERYDIYHESRPYICEIGFQDDNFPNTYITAQSKYITSFDGECDFAVEPYGKLRSLRLHVDWISNPVTVTEIRVVSAIPYSFSNTRFFVLFFILSGAAAISTFRLHTVKFDRRKRSHLVIADAMAILCALTAVLFYKPEIKLEEYIKGLPPTANPYAMQAIAFDEGQLHLDYKVDPAVNDVENIYSPDQRIASGVPYLWDYAYHDGKYYCYFGVTPTLTLFYPVYHIKHKLMPIPMAIFIFGILGIFFFCEALLAAVKLLAPKPNMLLLLFSMPTAVGCVGFYYVLNYADMYCIPLASGLMYLSLSLWLGLSAYTSKKKAMRMVMLTFSGISLTLAVGSRPGMALGAVVLAPFFLSILLNKKEKLSYRLGQAACFVVPLILGACGIMWYNNARFGSPFDFGAVYQLTVSDIHANKIHIANLPSAILHYFFLPLRVRGVFPFFEQQLIHFNNYSSYMYSDFSIPVFSLPMIAMGFIMLPLCFRKKNTHCAYGTTVLQRNSFYICALCMAVFITWEDFCLGGVIQRYIIDIMPLMTLVAVPALLRVNVRPDKRRYLYSVSLICICMTFVINWGLAVSHRMGTIHLHNPGIQEKLEDLIIFWR